jgi:hypothetical protein
MTPQGGPERVEKAREVAQALADEVPRDRQEIDRAKQALVEAEQHDREALAAAMRRGDDATSDITAIARAREQVGATERRHAARQLALSDADQELRAAVEAARDEWARTADASLVRTRRNAHKALEKLSGELEALAQARSVVWWLANGFDREQPVPHAVLGSAASSARTQANGEPLPAARLLGWLDEVIEPESREAPAQLLASA